MSLSVIPTGSREVMVHLHFLCRDLRFTKGNIRLIHITHRDQVLSPHGGEDDHAGVGAVVPLVRHPVPGHPESVVHGI